jgi:hypothetical protein
VDDTEPPRSLVRPCTRCRRLLDETDFTFKDRAKGRRHSYCKYCMRELVRDHYRRNVQYYIRKAKARSPSWRAVMQHKLLSYLSRHPCVDCGEDDPVVLEFDHIDPTTKMFEVSILMKRRVGWCRVRTEIEKCVVRCANCHRRRTAIQFGWRKLLSARSSIG